MFTPYHNTQFVKKASNDGKIVGTGFTSRYTITNRLLALVKRINLLVAELNHRRFPQVVLVELAKSARAISAHASTSIEGNPLPLTEVKRILKSTPAHIRQSEQEVLNYNQALLELEKQLTKGEIRLSVKLILEIHKQITRGLLPGFEVGKLRQKPVVVNDPRTREVIYLPPDHQHVKQLLEDLVNFALTSQGSIDPLILAGIFHKQLVLIHPFMDGNGRTARSATKVMLAQMGLDTFNLFSFENYYNQNVTRYFNIVGERGNYYELAETIDFTRWLEYFTEGIIDELLRVQKILPNVAIDPQSELQPYHRKILEYIQKHGFIKDRDYAKLTSRAKPTRALDFQKLIELGLIKRLGKGKATYYVLNSI